MRNRSITQITNNNEVRSPHELGRAYDGSMLDITGAGEVEVSVKRNMSGRVLWINMDGICVLRICRIKGKVVHSS